MYTTGLKLTVISPSGLGNNFNEIILCSFAMYIPVSIINISFYRYHRFLYPDSYDLWNGLHLVTYTHTQY